MADNDQDKTPEGHISGSARRRGRSARGETNTKSAPTDPSKLKFFKLIPENTKIDFVGNRRKGLMLSLILVLLSIGMMVFNTFTTDTGSALNYGIDFQGGSSVRLALTKPADVEEMRGLLDEAGYAGSSAVAVPDHDNEILIRVKDVVTISDAELEACRAALDGLEGADLLDADDAFVHPGEESSKIFMKFAAQPSYPEIERLMTEAGCDGTASAGTGKPEEFPVEFALIGVGNEIAKLVDERLGEGTVDHIVTSETVGAKVGDQLKRDGVQAMLFAIGFIFLFVMIRFDLRFAPGGIIALAHDAIIVIGAFALTGKEVNLQTIAAVLTIIGYSINDTIVVFDRVRERVTLNRDEDIELTTNTALNETLSRTILTSGTTLLVVVSIWVLGSGPIKDFAFALFVGMIVGTYSSLFIASPVFLWVNRRFYGGEGHLIDLRNREREGTGTLLGGKTSQPTVDDGEIAHSPKALPEGEDGASADDDEDGPVVPDAADLAAKAAAQAALADDKPKKATRRRRRRPNSE